MPDNLDPEAIAGMSRSKLLDVCDRLSEAEDFCRAIFMAAAGLGDRGDTTMFQSLRTLRRAKSVDLSPSSTRSGMTPKYLPRS